MTEFCRHILPSGRRCQAYAITASVYCYFHRQLNGRHRAMDPAAALATRTDIPEQHRSLSLLKCDPLMSEYYGLKELIHGPIQLPIPALEDRTAVQTALSLVLAAMAENRIDLKRATAMIYGLQVASANAAGLTPASKHTVLSTTHDAEGREIAPDEDPAEIIEHRAFLEALDIDKDDEDVDEEEHDDEEDALDEEDAA